ncbi:Lactate/malate dehydrogenase, N-terminal [Dillenia turbinata]|uniref:Lactate/malate dehydrogenase, N-terminal n=1 Tax=Dillenia turbinata TaxID=194707 RepID=A0AAN8YZH6_9MAGN
MCLGMKQMMRLVQTMRGRRGIASSSLVLSHSWWSYIHQQHLRFASSLTGPASSPSLSIWRRKKEMSKEGLMTAKELKRLQSNSVRLDRFIRSNVSRLLKSDLFAVLAEFQRQDQVFLCMKMNPIVSFLHLYDVVITPRVTADISHMDAGAVICGFLGSQQLENTLTGMDLVIIPAVPRKSGMTRDDLFNINTGICSNSSRGDQEEVLGLDPTEFDIRDNFTPHFSGKPQCPFTLEEINYLTAHIQIGVIEIVTANAGSGYAMLSMAYATIARLYEVVRKEIWYRPDMFFYRDMLMMLARNKKVDETKRVWEDLKREEVLFDQHTFGDIIRAFLDSGLPSEAMWIYDEMRASPEPPLSLPYRVILKGLIPYPELREKVKDDFLELFPDMIVYDPPEDLFEDQEPQRESEDDYH